MGDKDLELTRGEIVELDVIAKNVVAYTEDDRRKADELYNYYQQLISAGDTKGDTRIAMAKSLELRETSANNLIEILKLKTRLLEKKIELEIRKQAAEFDMHGQRRGGFDSSSLISQMDKEG